MSSLLSSPPSSLSSELGMVLRALGGAVLAPPVPAWPTYRRHLPPGPLPSAMPDPALVQARLLARLARTPLTAPWRLPWAPDVDAAPPAVLRVLAAVAGPVDDYTGPFPAELLPTDRAEALAVALQARGRPLDVGEQWEVALSVVGEGYPLAAALLLHITARGLARGRERRAGLRLWLDARLAWGQSFAALGTPEGDPLGDTAAYWAGVSAGLVAAWAKGAGGSRRIAGWLLHLGMFGGPGIRAALHRHRGRERRGGDHAGPARMGLRHGLALGVAILRQMAAAPALREPPPSGDRGEDVRGSAGISVYYPGGSGLDRRGGGGP